MQEMAWLTHYVTIVCMLLGITLGAVTRMITMARFCQKWMYVPLYMSLLIPAYYTSKTDVEWKTLQNFEITSCYLAGILVGLLVVQISKKEKEIPKL